MSIPPPTGTITLMFTDIEGSTALWERIGDAFRASLNRHNEIIRETVARWDGYEVKFEGDSFMIAFARATDAVECAVDIQRALHSLETPLYLRIGLHTGEPFLGYDAGRRVDYLGTPVNRAARICAAGHGGQILISAATRDVVAGSVTREIQFIDLGRHRLRGLEQLEQISEVRAPDLPLREYPPLRTLDALRTNLPAQITSFIGRDRELRELGDLLGKRETRLLTLTGAGGCGKTRLALRLAADVLGSYDDSVWLTELAALADPALVPQTVATALGVREEGTRPLTDTLTDYLKPRLLLLILDNCEHLLDASAQLADALLRACPQLTIVATSREGLGLTGEQTFRVPSLSLPDLREVPTISDPAALTQYDAVRLFIERAVLAKADFTVTNQNAPAVAQICHRLDGIPLALELAAARVKAMSVEQISNRLTERFRLLTGGSRTALPRQQTLRASIDWSYELLSEQEKVLLRRLSVFAGGWTLEAAEAVCADEVPVADSEPR